MRFVQFRLCARRWMIDFAVLSFCAISPARGGDFVHYESAHVHPLGLSPSGEQLYAINTPEARLAIFRVTRLGALVFAGDVPVGLEPVSLAVRPGTDEVWVANHLSDSVSIVDGLAGKLVATLEVGDEPTDVVFASGRAFVSLAGKEDLVAVYDAASRERIATLDIFGADPRAMAVSADGTRVALVVLESGNQTTAVPFPQRPLPPPSPPRAVIFPPLIDPSPAPASGVIVKLDRSTGKWLDETGGDWSDQVFLGFRFTLPDHDLFWIDAESTPPKVVQTVSAVGTNLFDVDIHPETGDVWVPNTEARNLVRFEPNLRGHLVETRVSIVDPQGSDTRFVDLNPHIDYSVTPGPLWEIANSLALPADGIFSRKGYFYYLTAFGSAKVGVLDGQTGAVLDRIAVGGGPSGLALNRRGDHLYVMQRFSNTITTVDTRTRAAVTTIGVAGPRAFDPSPPEVRDGRRILYDAQLSSGHGDLACASCHVFGNFDGLAWDLGNPQGEFISFQNAPWLAGLLPPMTLKGFDPMKGPLVTQTLRGLRGQEPFHWRGDRRNFEHFNGAFVSLMGRATPLSDEDMDAFTRFAMTIEYPPNPYRQLDDSLPATIAGHGNPSIGERIFTTEPVNSSNFRCTSCHGLPFGTIHHVQQIGDQPIEVAHLRNLYEKLGLDRFDATAEPRDHLKSGYGIFHNGVFTLGFFLRLSASFLGTRERDMSAFLLSFSTGTFPCVGRQVTMPADEPSSAESIVAILTAQAELGRCDLIAKGQIGDAPVGYAYDPSLQLLVPDSLRLGLGTPTELVAFLEEGDVITFTGVPTGSGARLGIDRDRDGCLDGDELSQQSDPASPGVPEADSDGDGLPDTLDLCAGWPQRDHSQHDSDRDGFPDECQCGDVNDDGWLDLRDVFALWRYLEGRPPQSGLALEKCNVTGVAGNDPSLCTWDDLVALSQSIYRGGHRRGRGALEARCLPEDPPISPVTSTCVDEPPHADPSQSPL